MDKPFLFDLYKYGIFVGMGMVVVYFFLLAWMFRRLRVRHPAVYQRLGEPSLFWNNSLKNTWSFYRFLFSSEPRSLDDAAASTVVLLMRIWLVLYLALFVAIVVVFCLMQ